MKRLFIILLILVAIVVVVIDNVTKNLKIDITSFKLLGLSTGYTTTTDLKINISILNDSWFVFNVNKTKIEIYNGINKNLITETDVIQYIKIPKGISEHELILKNINVVDSINYFINTSNSNPIIIVFKFKFMFLNLKFSKQIEI